MTTSFFDRALLSMLFIVVFAMLVKSFTAFKRWRTQTLPEEHSLLKSLKIEEPTLLYFWSAGCAQCRPQERQIEQAKEILRRQGKPIAVLKLNALEEQQLASSMRVMTVPTTVLVDGSGKVAAWNPGLTPSGTLVKQVHTVG